MPSFKAFAEFKQKAKEKEAQVQRLSSTTGQPAPPAGAGPDAAADLPEPADAGGDPASGAAESAAPPATPPAAEQELRVGAFVRVRGLQARPELNGLEGVLTSLDAQRSRWQVELLNGGGAKLFKATNLERFVPEQHAMDVLKAKQTAAAAKGHLPSIQAVSQVQEGDDGKASSSERGQQLDVESTSSASLRISPPDEDDDEAFVKSIEQCLKDCDVMWDDY